MIIIETTDGPVMLNEREVRGLEYNKEKGDLTVTFATDMPERMVLKQLKMTSKFEERSLTIAKVENIIYMGDQYNDTYEYKGSEIRRLQDHVNKNVTELIDSISHRSKQERIIDEYAFFLASNPTVSGFQTGYSRKIMRMPVRRDKTS